VIYFYETMPKRNIAKDVAEKVKAKACLICGEPASVRGLCFRHYEQYKTAKSKRPTKQLRAEFDAELIRDGRILSPWQVCELTRENPFSRE